MVDVSAPRVGEENWFQLSEAVGTVAVKCDGCVSLRDRRVDKHLNAREDVRPWRWSAGKCDGDGFAHAAKQEAKCKGAAEGIAVGIPVPEKQKAGILFEERQQFDRWFGGIVGAGVRLWALHLHHLPDEAHQTGSVHFQHRAVQVEVAGPPEQSRQV